MRLQNLFIFILFSTFAATSLSTRAQRNEQLLEEGWRFTKGDVTDAATPGFDDSRWESVTVPHDWAIYGPFSRENDLQNVAVTQNFETQASIKTGRTGGLPYVGVGWYRTTFDTKPDQEVTLVFDGAMSEARVYVNGQEACFWPCGYNSFYCNVTRLINPDGRNNTLAVRLENRPQSSRWYPGAGLYRNVHVITTNRIHIPVWGTQITTPHVADDYASVCLRTSVENSGQKRADFGNGNPFSRRQNRSNERKQGIHKPRATVYPELRSGTAPHFGRPNRPRSTVPSLKYTWKIS